MARPPAETLTGREAQVMDALWDLGEATADQVREALPQPLHDSTVRSLLRVLEAKGYLAHEARGKAYVYRATVERPAAQRHALRDVLARFFGGSAESLVMRLIEDEQLTRDQLDALKESAPPAKRAGGRRRKAGHEPNQEGR
jgi:predicted transcriptional regulator